MVNLSIVLYNTSKKDIENIFTSLGYVKSLYKLYVIDNSPKDFLRNCFSDKPQIIYLHNPSNPGFGASHNLALEISIKEGVDFHCVINPDVYFKEDVITRMVDYMTNHSDVGMMMPEILNLDGSIQSLPKLLPSPLSIILRKLKKPKFIYDKFITNYELRSVDKKIIYNAPVLSGCFTIFKTSALKEIGLYDDRFFMYFEDWDISRRMHKIYKTIYFPQVSIYHGYESGANKSKHLFKIFLDSANKYFNKWGWIFDKERSMINRKTLNQFK